MSLNCIHTHVGDLGPTLQPKINKREGNNVPEKNMNAAEDFLLLLLHTHVVAAAKAMQSVHPTKTVVDLAGLVVDSYVHLPRISDAATEECNDGVLLYGAEVLS